MSVLAWVLGGVFLGVISPFVVLQWQRRRDLARATVVSGRMTRMDAARPANPFAAVSIQPCDEPCGAVLQMHHIRYLAVRAPRLPVAGCDQAKCSCRYIRHSDRRAPGDRRDGFARFGGLLPNVKANRRSDSADRRQSGR